MMLRTTNRSRGEHGYALMMVIFISAVMAIMAAAVLPNFLIEGKRQKEAEMIWRGEQYERAVRLYYHKYGRFPQKIDDLAKNTNGMRFLRQAYPDPTNKADGSWRLIYVTPAGQLIGSVRFTSLQQLNAAQHPSQPNPFGLFPGNPAAAASSFGGPGQQGLQPGGMQAPFGQGLNSFQSQNPQNPSQNPNQNPGQNPGQNPSPSDSFSSPGSPLPPSDMSTGPVIGGNIIGVGGSAKKASVKVYLGGKTYRDWEFIWNPLAEATISSNQTGVLPGQPVTGAPGAQPNPMQTPQTPTMPQPPQNQPPQ